MPTVAPSQSRIKLPSISELTSSSSISSESESPSLPQAPRFPRPSSIQEPIKPKILPMVESRPLSSDAPPMAPPMMSSYYAYGQRPPAVVPPHMYPLSPYHMRVYYSLPPPPMMQPTGYPGAPLQGHLHMYLLPEVVNKPMKNCHRCGTSETPEWRRGPNGPRTLCNACGLFHAKLVKRKGAALAAEEVLHTKVCKGKNGRRISMKKQALYDSKKKVNQTQVVEISPIPSQGYHQSPISYSQDYSPVYHPRTTSI